MSEIFSAAGQIAGAAIQANAMKEATQMQIDALEKQRQFVFDQLSPGKINTAATNADVERAKNRLGLQAITDPELLKQRYLSQEQITKQLLGLEGGDADKVASVAASEAVAGTPRLNEVRDKLIDAALDELKAGATLPPDVQAELVQSGLEKTGQMSGAATTEGFGGQILRKLIGGAALQLKAQRQERAAALSETAQNMDVKRQQILQALFPNLARTQIGKLQASQGVLQQSNQMVPEAGLGGTDIANLWLARVGATNQLAQSAADAAARGSIGQSAAWGNALGGATRSLGGAMPSTAQLYNKIFSSNSSPDFYDDATGQYASEMF